MKKIVIWNEMASRAKEYESLLNEIDFDPDCEVIKLDTPTSVHEALSNFESKEVQIVVAGGDGTVQSVINAIMQQQLSYPLGIIPIGTANDFAQSLSIPVDPHQAYYALQQPKFLQIDVAKATTKQATRYFLNSATAGNSTRVHQNLDADQKAIWGRMCYSMAALDILADLENYQVEFAFDGKPFQSYSVWNVIFANGKRAGGSELVPQASLTDGLLDVIIIQDGDWLDVLSLSQNWLLNDVLAHERVFQTRAQTVQVKCDSANFKFALDGEICDEAVEALEVIPNAIQIAVS